MITNKIPQIAAPEDTHHSAAQLFLETITISKSCSIVITFGSHQAFFGWYIYTHLYCMDQGQIAGCPPFRPLSLHFDRSIYINKLNTQQPGIAFIFLNFIFFYHFNSYLLNPYYAIVDLLTFIYIIYFNFLQQYQISIIIPI